MTATIKTTLRTYSFDTNTAEGREAWRLWDICGAAWPPWRVEP